MIKCFLVTATERAWRSLRRYQEGECPGPYKTYHNAHAPIGIAERRRSSDGYYELVDPPAPNDPRLPRKCDHCDFEFTGAAYRQVFDEQIYLSDDGSEHSIRNHTPGMMWYSDYLGEWAHGPDGRSLHVVCPDGREWLIDGPCSNCGNPTDRGAFDKAHRCWVRHGTPPEISVDKNGRTCSAGGGSIDTKHAYHGFLGTNGAPPGWFT